MKPREILIEESILEKLQEHDISPFNITFTYSEKSGGLLSVTFYIPLDLDEFLNLLEYKTQCDKTGYTILRDTNTVLVSDMALINLYTTLL